MSIANLNKRLEKLQAASSKHLKVVRIIEPLYSDLTDCSGGLESTSSLPIDELSKGVDIVIVRQLVSPSPA